MGTNRDRFVADTKLRLDKMNARLDELEAEARGATDALKAKLSAQAARLRAQRAEVQSKLHRLSEAGADAWEELKAGVEEAAANLESAFEDAKSKVSA